MVSINIATFNRKALLDYTLESIFRQKGKYEVIVMDDGSTDDTESLREKYPKMIYEKVGHKGYSPAEGSAIALNLAAEMSKGDIILQQNAECFHFTPDTIKIMSNEVKSQQPVFATVLNHKGDPSELSSFEISDAMRVGVPAVQHYSGKRRKVPWFFCGAIMKQDWFDLGAYKIQPNCIDAEFGERMVKAGYKFKWLDEAIVVHQSHNKG